MIVSLISGGAGYLNGARALAVSLIDHEPTLPRMLLVENGAYNDKQIRLAEDAGWTIRIVSPVRPPACEYRSPRWPRTFTKLHAWSVDSPLAVFIDADCLAVQPFYQSITQRNFVDIVACWVAKGGSRFNSGVFAFRPGGSLSESMITEIQTTDPTKTDAAGSEQSYLNIRFPAWTQMPDRYNYRWWERDPKGLAIAHIRPHPWSGKKTHLAHSRIVALWKESLARS